MEDAMRFFNAVLAEIETSDPKHAQTLRNFNLSEIQNPLHGELLGLICEFFSKRGVDAKRVASDYLRMINDMRAEMVYFMVRKSYSCKNQHEAFEKVYSKPEVMSYYMNALTISQLIWRHHFKMLDYYAKTIVQISESVRMKDFRVLEAGAGHGLYSYLTRKNIPVSKIDIVDVSGEALKMTEQMIGKDKIEYIRKDIRFHSTIIKEYDLVIMGEILEHMDYPENLLENAYEMMSEDGILWITVPTNAPAIDHVYLFRDKDEVKRMVCRAGFRVFDHYDIRVEGDTTLIGIFCVKQ